MRTREQEDFLRGFGSAATTVNDHVGCSREECILPHHQTMLMANSLGYAIEEMVRRDCFLTTVYYYLGRAAGFASMKG